jgi:FkbM family methyltransferase
MKLFTPVREKLWLARRAVESCVAKTKQTSFWQGLFVRYAWRRPIWFTDKYGVTLRLDPDDNLRSTLERRTHCDDEGMLLLAEKLLKPGMTVLDVGTHHGQFALFAATLVGDTGQVHAFEPSSRSFTALCKNAYRLPKLAPRLKLNQVAIGREHGNAVLYEFPPSCSGWNSLNPHTMYELDRMIQPSHTEHVRVISVDEYCETQKLGQIDLLKIDVEGMEVEVLKGCSKLINKRHILNIIFEISEETLNGTGLTPADVLRTISDMGFDIQHIRSDGTHNKVHLPDFISPYFGNYLAIPCTV